MSAETGLIPEREDAEKLLHDFDAAIPVTEAAPMGLQHVVAAIAGIVTPTVLLGNAVKGAAPDTTTLLISAGLIFSGLATLIQSFPIFKRFGARLPLLFGSAVAYVPVLMTIGANYGLGAVFTSQIIGGAAVMFLGLFIKKIRVLFPPQVTGSVIIAIGLSLFPVVVKYMAGGEGSATFGSSKNWALAMVTFVIVFLLNTFAKGIAKLASLLIGMILGYLIALPLGMVDLGSVQTAGLFQLPKFMHFGVDIQIVPILTIVVIMVVDAAQIIGQSTATTVGAMDRQPTGRELSGAVMGSGFINFFGGMFGGMICSPFGQNVGLTTMTKVVNKHVMAFASVVLIIAGLFPKLSAILISIPYPVLGGAMISVFATIMMTGINMLFAAERSQKTNTIVGTALAFGVGISLAQGALKGFPDWVTTMFGHSGVIMTALAAVILNVILNFDEVKVGLHRS